MTEQVPSQPAAQPVPAGARKKARRVETMGMIAFLFFIVVVRAFGRQPLGHQAGPLGPERFWDWPSVIGIVGGVLAAILLLPRLGTIWRLPAITRTLTLIALFGLILHAALALPGIGKQADRIIPDPQGYARLAPQGPEDWVINGTTYHIASTCYLKLPEGLKYNIYLEHALPAGNPPSLEDALAIVRPFILYAYNKGYHLRASGAQAGGGEPLVPTSIGVSLFEKHGREVRICRAAMEMEQIRWRAAAEAPTPAAPAAGAESRASSPASQP